MMKNTKAIIFDAYGTLFDVNSAAEKCKDKIGDKWEGFANYWRTTQLEYTWLRSLMKRHKDFWQITEDSLEKSMKKFNINNNMRNELLNLYKVLSTFSEVKETLQNLKEKNFKLAILSNGTPELLDHLVSTNNLKNIFDDIFSIEEVKISSIEKISLNIFSKLLLLTNSSSREGVPFERIASLKSFSFNDFKTSGTSLNGERIL